jgi:hypothetical protein
MKFFMQFSRSNSSHCMLLPFALLHHEIQKTNNIRSPTRAHPLHGVWGSKCSGEEGVCC